MNVITIAGNLGKDSESRFLPNGDAVTSFSVADSQGKDKPSIWWNCSLFGKRGEALARRCEEWLIGAKARLDAARAGQAQPATTAG